MKAKPLKLLLILMIALSLVTVLPSCSNASSKVPSEVVSVTPANESQSGLITYMNYICLIKADVDWEKLPTARKQAIIEYTFQEVRDHAEENAISNYQIIGVQQTGPEGQTSVLFYFSRDSDEVIIYTNGEKTDAWPAP
ncbi:MAG: hypothetical protein FWD45_01790 [Coriobacteriia bacterium]|nr:hypothetical protein [Coriobacteriia bacterium]